MKQKTKLLLIAIIIAPSFFIIGIKFIENFLSRDDLRIAIIFGFIVSLIGSLGTYVWFRLFLQRRLIVLSDIYAEGARRVSVVFGLFFGSPGAILLWLGSDTAQDAPMVENILTSPCVLITGFIVAASLTYSVFWCIEGFGLSKNNDR